MSDTSFLQRAGRADVRGTVRLLCTLGLCAFVAPALAAFTSNQYSRDVSLYDTSSYSFSTQTPFVDGTGWDDAAVAALVKNPPHEDWRLKFDVHVFEVQLPDGATDVKADFAPDVQTTFDLLIGLGPTTEVAHLTLGAKSTYPVTADLPVGRQVSLVPFIVDASKFYLALSYTGVSQSDSAPVALAVRLAGRVGQTTYVKSVVGRTGIVVAVVPTLSY